MTDLTRHAFCNVNAMIEVYKVRKVMNTDPFERLPRLITCADRMKNLCIGPDLGVTCHAGMGRRNACEGGLFYAGVAITTMNAKSIVVMFMAEGNRLFTRHGLVCHVARPIYLTRYISDSYKHYQY